MNAQGQIPLPFRENIPLTNKMNAWNAITPDKLKTWKQKILWDIARHTDSTYDEIYSRLKGISWGTVVGRLSDWTKDTEQLLIVTGTRNGKSTYQLSEEGWKELEKI